MLNSFWGKFGENLHKAQTTAVYEAYHLFNLVSNSLLDIKQVRISNQDTLEVVHTKKKDNQPDIGRVNIFVAAFTTCHARLKLYESLERLQERVLYFDRLCYIHHQTWRTRYSSGQLSWGHDE